MSKSPGLGSFAEAGLASTAASAFSGIIVCCLLALVGVGAWLRAQGPDGNAAPLSPEIRKSLASLLPQDGQVGAHLTEGPVFYTARNLYSYINGAAEAFVGYDFVGLAHAVYRKGDAEIIVDVYDMGGPENAFGIYSSERSPDYSFVSIGAEGYQGDLLIHFFHDRYYVKLSAFSDTQKGDTLLLPFARSISSAISTVPSLPKPLSLFPNDRLVPRTQTFALRSPLGREFLGPAYTAKYSFADNRETLVVLSFAESAGAARGRITQWCGEVQKAAPCKAVNEPAGGFRGATRYEGPFLAFSRGKVAVIILNPPETKSSLVTQLLNTLGP